MSRQRYKASAPPPNATLEQLATHVRELGQKVAQGMPYLTVHDWGPLASAQTLDVRVADAHVLTLGASVALTFLVADVPDRTAVRLFVKQDATGSRLVSAWTGVTWLNGITPTLQTAAAALDLLEFTFVATLGTWVGRLLTGKLGVFPLGWLTGDENGSVVNNRYVRIFGDKPTTGKGGWIIVTGDYTAGSRGLVQLVGGTESTPTGDDNTIVFITAGGLAQMRRTGTWTFPLDILLGVGGALRDSTGSALIYRDNAGAVVQVGSGNIGDTTRLLGGAVTGLTVGTDQRVTIPVFIELGTGPAHTGLIRLTNDDGIYSRNVGNSGDVRLIELDSADEVRIGSGSNVIVLAGRTVTLAGNSGTFAQLGGSAFEHFTDAPNITTGETDLYSDSIAAATLATNGDRLRAAYGGTALLHATATRRIRAYFGGTLIFDTGALTLAANTDWSLDVDVMRVSSSVVRCVARMNTSSAALVASAKVTEVTGLTLANAQILKITGQAAGAGAATNDIVAKLGTVEWGAAA